ncbi:Amino acid transporter AVT1H [Camellia lanceoleosa]|uniref:Amino acid transporter AVT1H n=1 Tax=Camellia lanceoleosa TaxID=1840588 RepID=A0ACC0GRN8_9ERIC|nr:Amino acid transporter AVT1H [Camellia lanceoleosa]
MLLGNGNKCKSKNPAESDSSYCLPNHHHHQLLVTVGSETSRVHAALNLHEEEAAMPPWPSSSNSCFHQNKNNNVKNKKVRSKCDHDHNHDHDHDQNNNNNISNGIQDMKSVEINNNNDHKDHVVVEVEHAVNNANSSFAHAVINMVGMLIGLGQLSTPYALQTGGWASVFLLIGLGITCSYTSHLLGQCLSRNSKLMNYTDLGHLSFGTKGRILTTSFIYLEIFMALVSYTISLHDNLTTIFSTSHLNHLNNFFLSNCLSTSQLLTVIAVLVALPSLWLRDLSSISFLSSGGILMSVVIFATVACTAVFGGVEVNKEVAVLRLGNIPAISGLYIFSFGGHVVFPDLYREMRDPSKFTKVSIVSFSLVTALYTTLAFMGAKMFGPEVNPQITLSMPRNLIFTKIALWATVLTPMSKYALEFAPFAMQLERTLSKYCSMKSRTRLIIRGCVGSCLLLAILTLALSVPYFEYVLSLTGSLVSVAVCVIFPCTFYTKVFWTQISKPMLILNVTLVLLGCFLGASGTISSFKLLVRNLHRAHSP